MTDEDKTIDQRSYDEVHDEIADFDFDRALKLMTIIEKVTTVSPRNTAFIGLAQAELERMHTQAQDIALRRAERTADLQKEQAAREAKERQRQEAMAAQKRQEEEDLKRERVAQAAREAEVKDDDDANDDGVPDDTPPSRSVPRIHNPTPNPTPNGRRV